MLLYATAGDGDAARQAEQLKQQGADVAADLQQADAANRPYWKQLLTPYKVGPKAIVLTPTASAAGATPRTSIGAKCRQHFAALH